MSGTAVDHREGRWTRRPAPGRTREDDVRRDDGVPALAARRGSLAARFAGRLAGRHPALVFFAAVLAGWLALAALAIGIGLLVTEVLVPAGGIGRTDERFIHTLAADRTATLTDGSSIGSAIGGAPVLPILVGLIGVVCAVLKRWLIAGFAVFVLAVESLTYRVSSLAVPRHRPFVDRLEDLPANASFPSGHTAASIAVYCGLTVLLTSRIRNRGARFAAWTIALLLPVVVAMSRMYRGMHHPLDVAGGVVIGIGAIAVLLFACRAAGAASALRQHDRGQ